MGNLGKSSKLREKGNENATLLTGHWGQLVYFFHVSYVTPQFSIIGSIVIYFCVIWIQIPDKRIFKFDQNALKLFSLGCNNPHVCVYFPLLSVLTIVESRPELLYLLLSYCMKCLFYSHASYIIYIDSIVYWFYIDLSQDFAIFNWQATI